MDKKQIQATAVMVGYIIGVGMFGLPFLISKAGLAVFFIFVIFLGLAQYFLHLIYANLIFSTKEYHRLPGYAEIYLGKKGKIFVFIAKLIGNYGALLAYIIITGIFLNELLSSFFGENVFLYSSVLFFLEAIIVLCGIGIIAKVELFMSALLLFVVFFIVLKGWGAVDVSNYHLMDWKYFLLPYGAMLFALDGNGSLPIVVKLLRRNKKKVKKVIKWGTFIPVIVIMVFTLIVVGISGSGTTPDSLVGIKAVLDDGVVFFSLIFGVLTMVTSFLLVAESIKETLSWDFKINKTLAWALAVFVPYLFYAVGFVNLTSVISFVGAVGGGMCAIVSLIIFEKLKKQKKLPLFDCCPKLFFSYFLGLLFTAGIIYEVWFFIFK